MYIYIYVKRKFHDEKYEGKKQTKKKEEQTDCTPTN